MRISFKFFELIAQDDITIPERTNMKKSHALDSGREGGPFGFSVIIVLKD